MSHSRCAQHLLLALAVSIGAAIPAVGLAQDAASPAKPAGPNAPQAAPAPDIAHGESIALTGPGNGSSEQTYPCYTCHGRKGEGGANPGYPRLGGQSYVYLYQQLAAFKNGDRKSRVMQQVAQALDDKAMRDVAAYYAEQAVPPEDVAPTAPAGTPPPAAALQEGGALAAYGDISRGIQGCANCHGPKGGGEPPMYPALAGLPPDYLAGQLKDFKSGERHNDALGVMQDIAKRMTDQEIEEVAQYYAAIRPANPVPQTVGKSGLMPPPQTPQAQSVPSAASDQTPIAPAPPSGAAP